MSLTTVTIISPEAANGRNVAALGVVRALASVKRTGVFRPAACRKETFTSVLLDAASAEETIEQARGVCPKRARNDKEGARADIVAAYETTVAVIDPEAMVIVGTDRSAINDPEIFGFNADVAADLKSPVLLAVCTIDRTPEQVLATIRACTASVEQRGSTVLGVFITGADEDQIPALNEFFASEYDLPAWVLPKVDFAEEGAVQKAVEAFSANVPTDELLAALDTPFAAPVTPYAFQYGLLGKAKADKKTIVLPEGAEDRIIKAADYLLERDIVDLIIVGDKDAILARGEELGLKSLGKASFQSMDDEEALTPMVAKLCELRAKKGMTEEQARKQLTDASYFGTMLVVLGKADGLVSGSVNSTANTVRPALQVIKTKPGASLVSGSFLMCFKDHVAVFADCAINLNPNAEQLADIAIQSAETAAAFGIEPKVGMLSYSTLGSGKGPDVDLVEEATALVCSKAPDLQVVGSVQFDAAWSPTVAATKAKGNDVAGHVNVFVFPDLCAGNIAYKAVQRSSGAIAIGPVLQGLNKPVNDLSRGATVQDIINTVALTAVEAQQ
ncbi:MAG: phosphate acetyltransferase [Bifidobacterium merycicum]|uniref:Phosphate acetyltransferase n=1 Tax=Bifidobacterium merycicum TaxID=78345 RepID=A0A087BHF8_9BIFI|nr:phosphate acetyltransferase [Bifidobacterium merycicum]KFI70458.1 phosphate acetyltransferase [Bifidobacterium merycicum]MEE1294565.1 phosphate acetyltransferase [Bifidobacterium merycicum]MEE3342229.1 phosphate acetyltransferase [Bifidobacterium merycicum]SHE48801.1 phosphate acetyltransferase [Bifidobacterium merycicum DSM 6492]